MNTELTFVKDKILEIIRDNLEKHNEIYEESLIGYFKELEKQLERLMKIAKSRKKVAPFINLPIPNSHKKDYERIISMLEHSEQSSIILNEKDYARYILDDWNWKNQWLISNSGYSMAASAAASNIQGGE